jgi:hypothetical protein
LPIVVVQLDKTNTQFLRLDCKGLARDAGQVCCTLKDSSDCAILGKRIKECEDVLSSMLSGSSSSVDANSVDKLKNAKDKWSQNRIAAAVDQSSANKKPKSDK